MTSKTNASVNSAAYDTAHTLASPQAGAVYETVYDRNGNKINSYNGAAKVQYSTQNGTVIMTYPDKNNKK